MKGIAALSYLDPKIITIDATLPITIEAIKSTVYGGAKLQSEELPDGSYTPVLTNLTPYDQASADIDIVNSGANYDVVCNPVNTEQPVVGGQGRAALSTRRLITVDMQNLGAFALTWRSILAALNFVEKLEDSVARTGVSAEGDGTYTDVLLKGHSPYEKFQWTVVKLGAAYTLTTTANS